MSEAGRAIDAIGRLRVPQGRLAGERVRLAAFQRRFIEGSQAEGVSIACMSVARGNGKTGLAAALAVTHLLSAWAPSRSAR